MMKYLAAKLALLMVSLWLVSCQAASATSSLDSGKILLWHGWPETEAVALNGIIARFNEVYPNLNVISQAVPANSLRQQYEQAASLGLGPDVLIGPGEWLTPLADQEIVRDLLPFAPQTDDYLSRAVGSLTYKDGLYGLPLSLRPNALYYNNTLVDVPAANLDELLAQASNGRSIALNTNFLAAFWGIQAFGGRVFDETGRVVLDEGGFINWLRWLKNAQNAPGMILSRDSASLQDLFFSGQAAYYIGNPDELVRAREALGAENVSVAVLPAGPAGPSGPLLDVEAIYFNPASSPQQTERGLLLAAFLTNANQSTMLLREIGRVPANRTVPVDLRLHPAEAGFAAQARTAVSIPNIPQFDKVVALGNDLNRSVLEGVADVTEITAALVNDINSAYGFSVTATRENVCQEQGVLNIWHPYTGRLAAALEKFVVDYGIACPSVRINLTQVPADQIFNLFSEPLVDQGGYTLPDLVLGPSAWTLPFTEAQTIQPVTGFLSPEMRQRFIPAALQTLEVQSDIYGLPYWLDLEILYYNATLVSDPPGSLTELLQDTDAGHQVVLPVTFTEAYWGLAAFGGQLFSEEGRLALVETGFVDWLDWLAAVKDDPDIYLDENPELLQTTFYAGDVAMLVGPVSALGTLEQIVNPENLRITNLPTGPAGEARPWLQTAAFFITAELSKAQGELALSFIDFATNVTSQSYLLEETRLIPVNINVSSTNTPVLNGILQNVNSAFVPPNTPEMTTVLTYGEQVYRDVLSGQKEPLTAACEYTVSVDRANGFAVEIADLPALCQELADSAPTR